MESTKTHMGKTYAFDATAQGKGLWKQVTKAGKLGRIASNDLQKRWGNPNESGPLYETPKTNVDKMSDSIRDSAPKTERLKSFRSLLKDPNENVKSAALKSIKQNLRPEMIMKQIFGKTVGMMTAKGLGVSSQRMDAVSRGFAGANEPIDQDTNTRRSNKASKTAPSYTSSYDSGELNSYLKSMTEELKRIREKLYGENTIAVKFSKSSETYKQLEDIAEFANQEKKRRDLEENFKNIPKKQGTPVGTPTAVPTQGMTQTGGEGGGGGGIGDIISSMFGGLLGGGAGIGLAGLGKKLLSIIGKAFLGLAKKLPIIGPIIVAAMGLKDAYDEYMAGGDFSDAVGAFFESVADSLTFGLSTKLAGQGGIKKLVSGLVDSGLDFFEDMVDSIGDFLKDKFIDPIINLPTTLLNGIKGVVGDIFASIGNLSFEIPEFTLIPKTPFTDAVKIGPYKISPFSMFGDVGKNLQKAAAEGKAQAEAVEAQKLEERAKRDTEKQERRAERDERKAERAAGGGTPAGGTPAEGTPAGGTPQLPNNITFSEKDLSEKDPELYKEFVERKEQIKQELAKDRRYQSRTGARQLEDAANVQAQREFAERAEKVGAAQITPTPAGGGTPTGGTPTGGTPAGGTPRQTTQQLPNNITFSEKDLSEKDPELYKQFVERKEQLKQELAKDPRYQSRAGSGQLEDAANVQAQREFAERAEKVGAAQITPTSTPTTQTPSPTPTSTPTTPAPPSGPAPSAIPARQQNVDENLVRMRQALAEQGITDPNIVNATLANVMKETGGRNVSENMNYANSSNDRLRQVFGSRASKFSDAELDEIKKDPQKLGEMMYGASTEMGRKMGNTEEGEGYKFRGRGFVQLTGKNNYAKASQALFGDDRLVQNPDLLNDPDIAAKTSAWYMKDTQAGAAKMMGLDPSKLTAQQAQDLTTSQIAGFDVTKSRNTHIQELRKQVGQYSNDPRVQTAMGATLPTAQTQMASSDLVPEQRKTGDVIDQTATQLAETQMAAATPPASPPVVNNVTNNNVGGGGGGGQSQPAAPVRNEENSLMKAQMDAALLSMS